MNERPREVPSILYVEEQKLNGATLYYYCPSKQALFKDTITTAPLNLRR
jgi:hypothetical protein